MADGRASTSRVTLKADGWHVYRLVSGPWPSRDEALAQATPERASRAEDVVCPVCRRPESEHAPPFSAASCPQATPDRADATVQERAIASGAAGTDSNTGFLIARQATPDNGYDGPQPPDDFGEDIEATVTQFAGEPQATPDPLRVRSVILSESAATNPERILLSIRRARKLLGVADAHVEIVVRAYTGGE